MTQEGRTDVGLYNDVVNKVRRSPIMSHHDQSYYERFPSMTKFEIPGGLCQPENLREGAEYVYARPEPKHAEGQVYRLVRFVMDIPTMQWKVLVEAVTGKDTGLLFVCSVANFCTRYCVMCTSECGCESR